MAWRSIPLRRSAATSRSSPAGGATATMTEPSSSPGAACQSASAPGTCASRARHGSRSTARCRTPSGPPGIDRNPRIRYVGATRGPPREDPGRPRPAAGPGAAVGSGARPARRRPRPRLGPGGVRPTADGSPPAAARWRSGNRRPEPDGGAVGLARPGGSRRGRLPVPGRDARAPQAPRRGARNPALPPVPGDRSPLGPAVLDRRRSSTPIAPARSASRRCSSTARPGRDTPRSFLHADLAPHVRLVRPSGQAALAQPGGAVLRQLQRAQDDLGRTPLLLMGYQRTGEQYTVLLQFPLAFGVGTRSSSRTCSSSRSTTSRRPPTAMRRRVGAPVLVRAQAPRGRRSSTTIAAGSSAAPVF